MVNALFEKGREGFLDGTIDWDSNTIKAALLDLNTTDTGVKAITGATNATPIVVTATAHGLSNADAVYVNGVGGNLAANGRWLIANVTTNTFELQRPDGTNVAGSGAYTSGGYVVCMGPSTAGDNWDDFDACLVGTAQTLTSPTVTSGVADAADPAFASVSGASVEAVAIYKDTGTPSTSRMVCLLTGYTQVTLAKDAASSDTTLYVEKLTESIASGTVLTFSNGKAATLSSQANAGDRTLSVSSLANAITAGNVALAPVLNANLPVTPNGGTINIAFSNGANKIFKL